MFESLEAKGVVSHDFLIRAAATASLFQWKSHLCTHT